MHFKTKDDMLGTILQIIFCCLIGVHFILCLPDGGLLNWICHIVFCFHLLFCCLIAGYYYMFDKDIEKHFGKIDTVLFVCMTIALTAVNFLKFFELYEVESGQLLKLTVLFLLLVGKAIKNMIQEIYFKKGKP